MLSQTRFPLVRQRRMSLLIHKLYIKRNGTMDQATRQTDKRLSKKSKNVKEKFKVKKEDSANADLKNASL